MLSDYTEALFRHLDTDENDLVDALEFLATFAMISGMNLVGKVKFMFDCYDFDESGRHGKHTHASRYPLRPPGDLP